MKLSRLILFLVAPIALFCLGCTEPKYFPVRGTIVDETGKPLTELAGANISFESLEKPVSAVAEVRADGSFSMTTETSDDGCLPGEHRVTIGRVFLSADRPLPPVINPKYENPETSGLKVTVEKKSNDIKLQVERVK
jgi:hypothetical protein